MTRARSRKPGAGGSKPSSPPARQPRPGRFATPMAVALLIVLVLAAFAPVMRNGFVYVDDDVYLTENQHLGGRGLSIEGIRWAFSFEGYTSNWHPLTWISHMVDISLFGLDPRGHHLVSLLFHLANALLLFAIFAALTGAPGRSFVVAAFFAVHPLRVESVAWAAERKDVLSACFSFLALAAYIRYLRRPSLGRYVSVTLLFIGALLSKPMAVTLPFVFLLLDCWPLGRLFPAPTTGGSAGRLYGPWLEKLPWLVISLLSSVITMRIQVDATRFLARLTFGNRLATAVVAAVKYLGMMVWPVGLSVFYPHRIEMPPTVLIVAAAAFLLLVTVGTILLIRRRGYLAVGWLWYLGTLVPVSGLIQVGGQEMADRYTYVPLIGVTLAAVWGARELLGRVRAAIIPALVLLAVLLGLAVAATRHQVRIWRDSESLFDHAIAVTEDNHLAHYNLGYYYLRAGKSEQAGFHFAEAIRIFPADREAYLGLGVAYSQLGKISEEIEIYKLILQADPSYAKAWMNLAVAYEHLGLDEEASAARENGLRLMPPGGDHQPR